MLKSGLVYALPIPDRATDGPMTGLQEIILELSEKIEEKERQIESLKCCGTCEYITDCIIDENKCSEDTFDNWQQKN